MESVSRLGLFNMRLSWERLNPFFFAQPHVLQSHYFFPQQAENLVIAKT
jgi:hypothetical protein